MQYKHLRVFRHEPQNKVKKKKKEKLKSEQLDWG